MNPSFGEQSASHTLVRLKGQQRIGRRTIAEPLRETMKRDASLVHTPSAQLNSESDESPPGEAG